MKQRVLIAAVVLFACGTLSAANVKKSFRIEKKFTLAPGGSLVLDNPNGDIEIVGTDEPGIDAIAMKTIVAPDAAGIEEGDDQTALLVDGDERSRILRATSGLNRNRRWTSSVAWRLTIPRTAFLRVISSTSQRIRIDAMTGSVFVKNFAGDVVLVNDSGQTTVESVNGSVIYSNLEPHGNVALSTVNGNVTVSVSPTADLRLIAETVKGDIRTNLPARGSFFGQTYRGSVNAPGGPTVTMVTLMGNIHLIANGTTLQSAQSIRPPTPAQAPMSSSSEIRPAAQLPHGGTFHQPLVKGVFRYETNLGDIKVGEIQGDAFIATGAGEVLLGAVSGECNVKSFGGPLQLGEISGPLNATTNAGDITIDAARRGGTALTRGGTIRVGVVNAPVRLMSGGGDIIVRNGAAPVSAETRSGDVNVTLERGARSQKLDLKTDKGNVYLNVTTGFGADVEATIFTDDPAADTIVSDIAGLTITKEQVGNRTRVHAVGKLNGGGERVQIEATAGDIRIASTPR
ncbi:MAG: hypothetical protein JO197_09175 [Acidobacteria bacterium]|nr:hypothetical protein [Acidobacteriota bacterium]MBV9477267.1 hypothetical protein [Acidobacteriota bacterium]